MAAQIDVTHRGTSHPESANTLRTIVELVRRIMKADTASILGFSLLDETVTWKAASGFMTDVDYSATVFRQIGSDLARRAYENNTVAVIQGIGTRPEFPAEEFPIHQAEGICDVALAPLRIVGNYSGALLAGYRTRHQFTDDEKLLLQNLAEMASVVLESARLVEKIEIAERIWEQTFDAIDEGILVYDMQNRIIRCNVRAAELIDAKVEDVIGLAFDEAFRRLFGQKASDFHLAQTRTTTASRFEVTTEYGRRYIVSVFPIAPRGDEPATVVTLNDVTRMAEMQEQLSRSRRLGSVGQLAAGVAHEINNPLAAISTCAEAVIRDVRRTDEIKKHAEEHQWTYYLEEIVRQSQRCKEITRGLLDLTQQREPKRAMSDLNAIVRDCVRVAVQRPEGANIEFKMELDEKLGPVATDPAMVRQILDNLLSNATDALTEKGGKVTIITAREPDRALIAVEDDGPGIPAALLPRIFDPFVSTKSGGQRYGLGLAICAALAEALRTSITVESKEGAGSRFRVSIPRRAPEIDVR
jgi:two-component system NtrC family sensor kinase